MALVFLLRIWQQNVIENSHKTLKKLTNIPFRVSVLNCCCFGKFCSPVRYSPGNKDKLGARMEIVFIANGYQGFIYDHGKLSKTVTQLNVIMKSLKSDT